MKKKERKYYITLAKETIKNQISRNRSSRPEVFCTKGVLTNFTKFKRDSDTSAFL